MLYSVVAYFGRLQRLRHPFVFDSVTGQYVTAVHATSNCEGAGTVLFLLYA